MIFHGFVQTADSVEHSYSLPHEFIVLYIHTNELFSPTFELIIHLFNFYKNVLF